MAEAMLDEIIGTPALCRLRYRARRGCRYQPSAGHSVLRAKLARLEADRDVFGQHGGGPDAHGTWRLTIPELRALRGPIVYVLSHEERVLYIGQSSQGLCRPLASQHHVLSKFKFTGEEELNVHSCTSVDEAIALEKRLIATLQPQLNRVSHERRTILQVLAQT